MRPRSRSTQVTSTRTLWTNPLLPNATQLLGGGFLRQDQAVARLVRLDDLQRKPLADVLTMGVGTAPRSTSLMFPTEAR